MHSNFIHRYQSLTGELATLCKAAKLRVEDVLDNEPILIHGITSRVKTPDSIANKLRRKTYEDPWSDITDIVGIRVILYYEDHVEGAVRALKDRLNWSRQHTTDKAHKVGSKEFSYRSYHVVAELPREIGADGHIPPQMRLFEIQVRSLLAHAWAQIEHEVIYKSGVDSPETVRRFGALSGALEILEREFIGLRKSLIDTVEQHVEEYRQRKGGATQLDSARLIAAMKARGEGRAAWQSEAGGETWYSFEDAKAHLEILSFVGLTTWNALRTSLETDPFKKTLHEYCTRVRVDISEVDHRTMIQIASLLIDPTAANKFQETFNDPAILVTVESFSEATRGEETVSPTPSMTHV